MHMLRAGWHHFPGSLEVSVTLSCAPDDAMSHPPSVHVYVWAFKDFCFDLSVIKVHWSPLLNKILH